MITLLGTLLLVHCGYTFIPVKQALLGEPVIVNCDLPKVDTTQRQVQWYKQSPGDTLRLIANWIIRPKNPGTPVFAPGFGISRWSVNNSETFTSLKILGATHDDEGTYHCAVIDWRGTKWNGTYLIVKGNTARTSQYTVFQQSSVSDPGPSADVETLQCSVFTDLENNMCSANLSVFWFRAEGEESHPDIIYIDKNKQGECVKKSDNQRSCFFHSSKKVISSDSATYYCAIATCRKILFGNATEVNTEQTGGFQLTVFLTLAMCLVISVTVNIGFICFRPPRTACSCFKAEREITTSHERNDFSHQLRGTAQDGNDVSYAALDFSGARVNQGRKKKKIKTEESLYSSVRI